MRTVLEITSIIGRIPYMTVEQAEVITGHIVEHNLAKVLELGFYHGASTCYIANAVSELPNGKVVSIDKKRALTLDPNIESLLQRLGLRDLVDVHYEPTSYTWRLMKLLEAHTNPVFDLCYLDGAHNWYVDGFAFFLVDRLLKPGGWLIMDDLNWRYAESSAMKGSEALNAMPEEEASCYQLRKVFELLVQRQPGYCNFREEFNWGFAQKRFNDATVGPAEVQTKIVVKERRVGLGEAVIKLGRRLGMR